MNNRPIYHIMEIIRGTTVDGPGFRTSIYMAGCDHRCPGCHNPQTWNPDAGREMTLNEIMEIVREEGFDVTLTGGDPLCSPELTFELVKSIKSEGYGIWLYTGFTMEEIQKREDLRKILPFLEAIVDGPFIESLKSVDLPFRGSSNQRIIFINNLK